MKLNYLKQQITALISIAVILFPMYWMLNTSLQVERNLFRAVPSFIPIPIQLTAYKRLLNGPSFIWLANTAFVAIVTSILTILASIFPSYALSRIKVRIKKPYLFLILFTQMVPPALLIIPLFVLFRRYGLLNSLWGLVMLNSTFSLPIGIWVLKDFFDTVPSEIDQAAIIDGCSTVQVIWKVYIPLSASAIVAVGTLAFFVAWNEFLFASVMLFDQSKWVSSVGLASFIGFLSTPLDEVLAGALIFSLPAVVFFLLIQRNMQTGITAGALKS